MSQRLLAILVLIAGLLSASCQPAPRTKSAFGKPIVVATTSFLADLASILVGEDAQVISLMGPGVDPHLYKPTAGDLTKILDADVVLVHGLHLEGRMEDALSSVKSRGRTVITAGELLQSSDLLQTKDSAKKPDPHVWFDPQLWSQVTGGVAEGLAKALPALGPSIKTRAKRYQDELGEEALKLTKQTETIPKESRVLVTAHDAFAYFGRAFGFEVHGIQGISTATEAGAQDLSRLADLIASRRIRAIFAETTVSGATIKALQEAVKAKGWDVKVGGTLYSDAVGPKGSGCDNALGALRCNVETVVGALR
jgi:manganese/zinc/iron transport system substrate-binding protein